MKQVKVCQVLHGIVGGGSEQVVLNYCSRMPEIHFDLLYQYEPNAQILERFKEANINCIQIPDKVHHPLRHLWNIYRIFRQGKYDAVHCHLDWFMNCYVCFLAMLAGVKKRIAHHHQAYHPANPLLKFLCALLRILNKMFATHWLACGKAAAVNGWGKNAVEKNLVTILPNAIDLERFKFDLAARKEIREHYGIAEDDFVVGHVGRFFPQKNHSFLIDVFAEFGKRNPSARLLLLGDGPLLCKIQDKVESLGLADKVVFAGLQKNPVQFYSAMDVFCFPSLWEGLPLTLVEAQYNGLPVVTSDNVTDEVRLSKNFEKLPIEHSSISLWSEKLSAVTRCNETLMKSGAFDINKNYKILEKIYLG